MRRTLGRPARRLSDSISYGYAKFGTHPDMANVVQHATEEFTDSTAFAFGGVLF
jgi:hypothetical protein